MSNKIDLFKQFKAQYVAKAEPTFIDADEARYLAIEGSGPPGSAAFERAIAALYGMAYTIKMTRKSAGETDYVVSKLEAQWWGPDGETDLSKIADEDWLWRLMIRTPDFVEASELSAAREALHGKNKGEGVDEVGLLPFTEGRCVQMLHVGPYEDEPKSIAMMCAAAESGGYVFDGVHHEIYVSDPRRVAPEKLKTILRRPLKPAAQPAG